MTEAGRRPLDPVPPDNQAVQPRSFAAPSWLTNKEAKAAWKRVVPELARFNIMTDVFVDTVGRYCEHFAHWVKLTRQIRRQGDTMLVPMTNGGKMRRANPAIRIRDTIEKAMIDLEDRFGISPLARYRIAAHQAANPGQRDLFRDDRAPSAGADPAPPPQRTSPIGALH